MIILVHSNSIFLDFVRRFEFQKIDVILDFAIDFSELNFGLPSQFEIESLAFDFVARARACRIKFFIIFK